MFLKKQKFIGEKIVKKIIIILLLAVTLNLFGESFTGKCISVLKGDEVLIKKGRKKILVKLEGIDCPDKGEAYYISAKMFTKDMILDKVVSIVSNTKIEGKKLEGKIIINNKDLGILLVRNGYAWHYTIKSNSEMLKNAELYAKNNKLGLWKGNKVSPYDESDPEEISLKETKHKNKIYKNCKEPNCKIKTRNKDGYCSLHEKDEDMERINKKYEDIAKKRELKKQKNKKLFQESLVHGLFTKYDKFTNITWYHAPNNIYSSNNINLYIGKKNNGEPWLVLRIQYSGDTWLFVKSYILNVDDKNHYITPKYSEIKRDNDSSGVWEWYQKTYPNIKLLQMIGNSKITELRYVGSDLVSDKIITKKEKQSIKTVLKGYYKLKN